MITILGKMATLFLVAATGYLCRKTKLSTPEFEHRLSKLVISVTMPCTVLYSVMSGSLDISRGEAAFLLLMMVLMFVIAFAVTIPTMHIFGGKNAGGGVVGYMMIFGNIGFMGIPITQAIFGSESAFFVALLNIPFNLLAFSVGIMMISGRGGRFSPKLLINPAMVSVLLTIVIFLTGFKTPSVITDTVQLIGGMTTPSAMLIIGSTLGAITLKSVFAEWRIYPAALLKLLLIPFLTWLVLRQFLQNGLALSVLVVLSGMPAASSTTMFAMEYGGDEHLASKCVFLSTLLSVVTIPLMAFLLSM